MKLATALKTAAALTFLASALLVSAQGGGRGMRGGFGGGGVTPNAFLLMRPDVQRDLSLTADETTALQKLQQDMMASFRGNRRGGGGGAGGGGGTPPAPMTDEERKKAQADREAQMKEMDGKVQAILTPDQYKRLSQIGIQLAKNRAVDKPEVADALKLTDDQKAKIKSLEEDATKANGELRTKMRNQEISREDGMADMTKNTTALDDAIGGVLTDAQKSQLKDMGGAEFKADPPGQGFGGGGGL